jgi:hypothetical protein
VSGEGEREGGALDKEELGLTRGARGGYMASKFCVLDTH